MAAWSEHERRVVSLDGSGLGQQRLMALDNDPDQRAALFVEFDWSAAGDVDAEIAEILIAETDIARAELHVAHAPERVLPGKILREVVENDRIIGGVGEAATQVCADFYRTFVSGELLLTSARTAETVTMSNRFTGSASRLRFAPGEVLLSMPKIVLRRRSAVLAASIRDPDPVIFFEQKSLYATKGDVPDGEHVEELGKAKVVRDGDDVTIVALAAMVPRAVAAAERLEAEEGISAAVVDLRCLVPLDTQTILAEVKKTARLVTVEENPRLCGWGAEISSIVAEECFYDLDGPIIRITTPHIPLPATDELEDAALPSVARIVETIREGID